MELIIVPDDDLVRAGGRLTSALGERHDATLLSRTEFESGDPPGPGVGVIFLGEAIPPELVEGEQESTHGARWGYVGNRAWISASAVDDPQAALDAMGEVIADLQADASAALFGLGTLPDPAKFTGIHLAARYLDPKLRVPAQTVAGGQFSFTPERMCWERQYTLGVVQFLARGFDPWTEGISG